MLQAKINSNLLQVKENEDKIKVLQEENRTCKKQNRSLEIMQRNMDNILDKGTQSQVEITSRNIEDLPIPTV